MSLLPQYLMSESSLQPRRSERLRSDNRMSSRQGLDLFPSVALMQTTRTISASNSAAPLISMENPIVPFNSMLAPNHSVTDIVSPFEQFSTKPIVRHDYDKLLHIDLTWEMAKASFSANNNHIVLNQQVCQVIGKQGIEELKRRISVTLGGAPVIVQKDGSSENLRIMKHAGNSRLQVSSSEERIIGTSKNLISTPTRNTAIQKVPARSFGKKSKIPRPPNAFILYRQHWHPHYKQQNQFMHNNDISKEIGKRWRSESEEIKAKYRKLAEDLKDNHAQQNPGYHYTPRKPGEKKRRMTAKKLARIRESQSQTEDNHAVSPASTTIDTSSVLGRDELDELNNICQVTTARSHVEMTSPRPRAPFRCEQDTEQCFMSLPSSQMEIRQESIERFEPRGANCLDAGERTGAFGIPDESLLYARPSSNAVDLQTGWESMINWKNVTQSTLSVDDESYAILDSMPEVCAGPESAFTFADPFGFESSSQQFR